MIQTDKSIQTKLPFQLKLKNIPLMLTGLLVLLCGCDIIGFSTNQAGSTSAQDGPKTNANAVAVKQTVKKFNWPCWRGPEKNGLSEETNWNTNWETPPKTLWANQIGIGYSAVSIDKGRLFTMGHPAGTETETMWCFDAVTGKEIWSKSYPCVLLNHLHKGGPCATPTIDGDFVYFNSREGEVRKVKALSLIHI